MQIQWKFTTSPLNIIDLCTILPFLIEEFLPMKWMKEFRGIENLFVYSLQAETELC